ncbi:hypothetical protein BC835DRAFT_101252 [Cytidiella melzeri]|nr:hypothetical protein BC835DRAFT_101252 [Cytidiella melzeri]
MSNSVSRSKSAKDHVATASDPEAARDAPNPLTLKPCPTSAGPAIAAKQKPGLGNRLTKPTLSQLARDAAVTTRRPEAGKTVRSRPPKSLKGRMKADVQSTKPGKSFDPVGQCKVISPCKVPLPPSPIGDSTSQHDAGLVLGESAPSDTDDIKPPFASQPSLLIDPATPTERAKPPSATTVDKTPISALVDSIQHGFMFTSLPSGNGWVEDDDEDLDPDDTFTARDMEFLRIAPLSLGRKGPSMVQ